MAVPPVLGGLVRTRHGPNRTGRGGRTAASSSTSYGTTSRPTRCRSRPIVRETRPAPSAASAESVRPELLANAVDEQLDASATTTHIDVETLAIGEQLAEVAQGKAPAS